MTMQVMTELRGLAANTSPPVAPGALPCLIDRLGLRWTRATIAAIELGRRQLSIGEFLLLPCVLGFSQIQGKDLKRNERRFPQLADLFPETGWVSLSSEIEAKAEVLHQILHGDIPERWLGDVDKQEIRAQFHVKTPALLDTAHRKDPEREKIVQHVWPEAKKEHISEAEEDAKGDAEQKAAQKLSVPPFAIALAARRVWYTSLTKERDHQVSEQVTAEMSPRTLQAIRGHVTRALLSQLQPYVEQLSQSATSVEN